jgi:hypothetical protein
VHILLADETNRQPTHNAKFFVYGGLILQMGDLPLLHDRIAQIRERAGYCAQDDLKFDTHARPTCVPQGAATEAKRQVLEVCRELGAKFIAYVALHDIIQRQDPDDQLLFAANTVISQFNRYLRNVAHDDGICIVDNLPVKGSWQYLAEKFTVGLTVNDAHYPLDHIRLFAATCNNASHASSAMDIVLGTFRYCINNPANREAAATMMGDVVNLMWHERDGRTIKALGRGLVMRPKREHIRVDAYKAEYDGLIDHINQLLAARH